jgi:hypothetical protein
MRRFEVPTETFHWTVSTHMHRNCNRLFCLTKTLEYINGALDLAFPYFVPVAFPTIMWWW